MVNRCIYCILIYICSNRGGRHFYSFELCSRQHRLNVLIFVGQGYSEVHGEWTNDSYFYNIVIISRNHAVPCVACYIKVFFQILTKLKRQHIKNTIRNFIPKPFASTQLKLFQNISPQKMKVYVTAMIIHFIVSLNLKDPLYVSIFVCKKIYVQLYKISNGGRYALQNFMAIHHHHLVS